MKIRALVCALVVVIGGCTSSSVSNDRQGHVDVGASALAPSASASLPSPLTSSSTAPPERAALEAYVLDAMHAWAPPTTMIDRDVRHYDGIAHDIAEVVSAEPPVWSDDHAKSKTAILLAAIAFWESHFWKHVDDGTCNDPIAAKKAYALIARTGNCDGGWAYSLWQIHPEGGIVLTNDNGWKHSWDAPGEKAVTGPDMIKDRRVAARVALRMARASITRSGTLCGYSGEPGPCPKAAIRLDFAKTWTRTHPYAGGPR